MGCASKVLVGTTEDSVFNQFGDLEPCSLRSGNFGAVYRFNGGRQAYALKVFDKAQPDRQQRYQLIDQHLAGQPQSSSLVSFR